MRHTGNESGSSPEETATKTSFTDLVGCQLPLQLAAMPGIVTVDLAVAVADAGGFPMLPGGAVPASLLSERMDAFTARSHSTFGVGFLMPFLDRDAVRAAAGRARLVEFFYGNPDAELVRIAHDAGSLACWQVGSVAEAAAAADARCDILVVQGIEAGGHVRGEVGLFPLLSRVVAAAAVPVVAAGGISSAATVAAALAAGAAAVRIGTRFVAARESGAHPAYIAALAAARAEDTVLTEAYSVMWPNAPHRVLRSCVDAAQSLEGDISGEMMFGERRLPVPRFAAPCPDRSATGQVEAMALYAGHSVDEVRGVVPAGEIVRELFPER